MRCVVATLAALGLVTSHAAPTYARPNCPEIPLAGDPCNPDPDPDPDPPPPPPPYVSTPDAVFQIGSCLPSAFEGDVRTAVQGMVPGAEVRVACLNGTERVGAWLTPMSSRDDASARQRGLSSVSILSGAESFAARVSSAAILRQAYAQWNALPKTLGDNGQPSASGPTHLTSFTPRFVAPSQVTATVQGYDERPWPDVDFTLVTTDTLSVSGGKVHCQSANAFSVDTSLLNILTGVFAVLLPPLGIVFGIEDIIVSGADVPVSNGASLACPAVQFFPGSIMLPGGLKANAAYSRVTVDNSGITAGGSFSIVARSPSASISGPRSISVQPGRAATGSYAAIATDMRPPLSYRWSASGSVTQPTSFGTKVNFGTGASSGQVSVTVTDADNLSATGRVNVTIHEAQPPDDDPPVCRKKPWLPQCQVP